MSTAATATGAATPAAKAPVPSDPRAIEQEIAVRQARLAATVDELTTRLSPKEIARRTSEKAQAKAHEALYAEDGSLRVERVGAVAGAVVTVASWVLWRRRRRKKRTDARLATAASAQAGGYRYEVQRVPSRR